MKVNLIRESIAGFVKNARAVSIAIAQFKHWRARPDAEAERLDRIRNPLKYLGK